MDYFSILNLDREPFSNSPDPEFFFQSRQHVDCLQKLELALRLKRGLNVVIGAVGAGKTTLCRTLLKKFASDPTIASHLILDPSFNSPLAFLESICAMIVGREFSGRDAHEYKERIKHHLFQKGVDQNKTIILIIDEGQKLPGFCLEILREFLNYETNDNKLLQIVLFAQEEFKAILDRRANLADRVNLIHYLGPMNFADTRDMIHFRIKHASSQPRPPKLFTRLALRAVFRATEGYPRKIVNLCHQCMLALIVQNRSCAGWRLVQSCAHRALAQRKRRQRYSWAFVLSLLAVLVVIGAVYMGAPGWLPSIYVSIGDNPLSAMPGKERQVSSAAAHLSVTEIPPRAGLAPVPGPSTVPLPDGQADHPQYPAPVEAVAAPPSPVAADPVDDQAGSRVQTENADDIAPPLPSLLGALTVKKKDTLGLIVKVIYGDFQDRYLKAVLDANPHIRHPDAIRVGDRIAIPAIQVPVEKRSYPSWWLKVGESDSLETAFRWSIKALKNREAPLMRMIPAWDPGTGLTYGVYFSGYFLNPSDAETMMARLPDDFSGSAEIISGWPDPTILFSDPFLGNRY